MGLARMPRRRAPRGKQPVKCHSDPDPGNLLVSTLRPDREDLIRKWTRPRPSRVVSYAQCYRRRALSFASQRREDSMLWNELCHWCHIAYPWHMHISMRDFRKGLASRGVCIR